MKLTELLVATGVPALLFLAVNAARKRIRRRSPDDATQGASAPIRKASADEIRAYFKDAARLRDTPINATAAQLGPWDAYDDWDWGRQIYEWNRRGLRVMVSTQGGQICKVALLDPTDSSRFGTVQESLLDAPFTIERAAVRGDDAE